MQHQKDQLIITIIAIILVLLFLGILFLILIFYYNNKKMQLAREKQVMKDAFEKQLLESRLEIQDETFNTISQEIHDNVGQTLSLAKVQVSIIDQREILDKDMLQQVKESIGRAMTDLRDIAKSLNSRRIQLISLSECITQELERVKKTGFINTSLTICGEEHTFDYQQKLILVRIIQETLQNILKHAGATEVTVQIDHKNPMSILIHDNGIGFSVEQATHSGNGIGLQNIMNRATLIGGSLKIESFINQGTIVTITIPYV
jgi:two-component system NarL family sensor kinase